jgi:hypothetical protein
LFCFTVFLAGGSKIGNVHLKWAFSEAEVLFLRGNAAKKYYERLFSKHGKGKALSVFAHKLGRDFYFILKNKETFDHKEDAMTIKPCNLYDSISGPPVAPLCFA